MCLRVRTCLLAGIPTSLWPSSVKATVEGVVLIPTNTSEKCERDVKLWWSALTFSIFDDSGVVSFHDCNARVRRAEIDANNAK